MSLYAIGDLHLHFQAELKAPGQLHEPVWKNHEVKFRQNCEKLIRPDDTLVLAGDPSWGKNLAECEKELATSAICQDERFSFGGTMTCSGTRRKRSI